MKNNIQYWSPFGYYKNIRIWMCVSEWTTFAVITTLTAHSISSNKNNTKITHILILFLLITFSSFENIFIIGRFFRFHSAFFSNLVFEVLKHEFQHSFIYLPCTNGPIKHAAIPNEGKNYGERESSKENMRNLSASNECTEWVKEKERKKRRTH